MELRFKGPSAIFYLSENNDKSFPEGLEIEDLSPGLPLEDEENLPSNHDMGTITISPWFPETRMQSI